MEKKIWIILYSFREPLSGSINKSRFSLTTEEGIGGKDREREGGKEGKESPNNSNLLKTE